STTPHHDSFPTRRSSDLDEKNMTDAQDAGVVEDPVQLASNVMVMVVPSGNPGGIESVEDISDDNTFVLCDPQVPCGSQRTKVLRSEEHTSELQSRFDLVC